MANLVVREGVEGMGSCMNVIHKKGESGGRKMELMGLMMWRITSQVEVGMLVHDGLQQEEDVIAHRLHHHNHHHHHHPPHPYRSNHLHPPHRLMVVAVQTGAHRDRYAVKQRRGHPKT